MKHFKHRAEFDENHLAVLDIETISGEEMPDGGFPPWPTHTPIVCSILTADRDRHGEWTFGLESIRFNENEAPLQRIDELLTGRSCVTFNGRGFDLPVLALTAQKTRCFHLPALMMAATEPRFHSAKHYDLADRISNYGSARGTSLERLCKELSIPAKFNVHGSEVGKLYDEGKISEIVNYCESDVAATLLLYAHQRAFERGDAGYFASLTAQFARWVHGQFDTWHLHPFAKIDEIDRLLSASLIGQIEAARANARADADLREQQRLDDGFGEIVHY